MDDKTNSILKQLHSEISKDEDDELINKLASEALLQLPGDKELEITKIISEIKTNRVQDAIATISKSKHKGEYNDYLSYCNYKKGEFEKSLDLSLKASSSSELTSLLTAQNLYKLERYEESYDEFKKIYDTNENEKEEISVNMMATLSKKALVEITSDSEESTEFLFNKALLQCFHLDKAEAKNTLKQYCDQIRNEESESDKIIAHLLLDYISLNSEQSDDRIKELNEISNKYTEYLKKSGQIDDSVKSILFNNLLVVKSNIGGHMTFNEGVKSLDEAIKFSSKLSSQQILSIKLNKLIYCLVRNKIPECWKLLEDLEKSEKGEKLFSSQLYIILKAYLIFKNKGIPAVLTYLQELSIKANDKEKLFIHLLKCELSRKSTKAFGESIISLIETFPEILQRNEFLSFFWSLMSNNEEIFKIMESQIDKILENTENPLVLKKASEYKIEKGEFEKAAQILKKSFGKSKITEEKGNELTFYSYLYSLSKTGNIEESKKLFQSVTLPTLLTTQEIEKLESDLKSVKLASKTEEGAPLKATGNKKRRKRKGKLPKDFNPDVKPDPERWLPKYERSKYKKLFKKKGFKGSQGESTGQETVQTFKHGPSTTNTEASASAAKRAKDKKKKRK